MAARVAPGARDYRAAASVRSMAEQLRTITDRVFLVESSIGTWSGDERLRVSRMLRHAAEANQITLIPVTSLWQLLSSGEFPSPYGEDNHHPSEFGSFPAAAVTLQTIRGFPLERIPCAIPRQPHIILDAIVRRTALTLTQSRCARLLGSIQSLSLNR